MIAEELVNSVMGIAGTGQGASDQKEPGVLPGKKTKLFKRKDMTNVFKTVYEKKILDEAAKPPAVAPNDLNLSNKQDISNNVASELFARCRALATITHFAHLSTDSYSEHQALATFYDDIIDSVDAFCEAFIGLYGKFITLPQIPTDIVIAVDAISELRDWIVQNKSLISDDSSIQNLIDAISELCNTTIYKLQKLK